MTPEERQLLTGLFDRMRPAANQPRDRDAEALIAEQVRAQPYAAYLLSQTVIVQDQALQAANQKIQQLESQVQQGQPQQAGEGGFLGGLGRSIFGGGQQGQPQGRAGTVPNTGYGGQQGGPWGGQQGGGPQGGSWGGQPGGGGLGGMMGGAMGGGGGGFLKGALGAAAGVAGGVLLADGIRNLFTGGHNPLGIASGMEGMGGLANAGGETVINNYYNDDNQQGPEPGNYGTQASDAGSGSGNDGGYDGGYTNDV